MKKVASEIRHAVCQIIEREIKDPRLGFITITYVDVSADLKIAKIYFTIFGNEKQKQDSQDALKSAVGFIRTQMTKYLRIRYMPELDFRVDEFFEYGQKVEDIFKKIHTE
jgi:ribosome-binding factor A